MDKNDKAQQNNKEQMLKSALTNIPSEAAKNFIITDLSSELYKNGIVKRNNVLAFIIDNFLSSEECKNLIKLTEAKGYEPALVNIGFGRQKLMTDVRQSDRCIIDDEEFADLLFQRVPINNFTEQFKNGIIGLNERMRFLRYEIGGYFKPHMDGQYIRPDGKELSLVTFFLFLNGDCKGGESTFVNFEDESLNLPCVPKEGRLVVFEHRILHEGSFIKKGKKYALRTDFMYKNKSKQ